MRYYIISGEASGDLHASNLIKEIRKRDDHAIIRAWGGDLMQKEGAEIVKHYKDLAFMGFVEVLMNIRTITKNLRFCKEDILAFNPDTLILVDYPGFNLRIAEFARKHGIRTVYYISPQIWAWKKSRIKKIKRDVDQMIVILPFEKEFYARYDYPVHFVGHPLLDVIENYQPLPKEEFLKKHGLTDQKIIALLPGSRKQEINTKLKIMAEIVSAFPDYQFVIAAAPSIPLDYYNNILNGKPIKVVNANTYNLLSHSYAALVTSGTATLETALFEVPEVVCYKGSAISYHIAKRLIEIKYISLVNLIMDKEVVKELIQHELTTKNLITELTKITQNEPQRSQMLSNYKVLKEKLGGVGASANAAQIVMETRG